MGQTINYPNGQTLTSTALTVQQINILVQALTCGMLGIVPVDVSKVRVDWQFQGQPDVALPSQDSCYISCVLEDVPYSRVRDHTLAGVDGAAAETWVYTRGWRFAWALYGPNSFDRARQVHSALFQDYFNTAFEAANLYPVLDPAEPVRMPIEHNAQWYDSSQFHCVFYEQITETIQSPAVTSVEIKVYDKDGQVADITINA
jgi:hypothetical protein